VNLKREKAKKSAEQPQTHTNNLGAVDCQLAGSFSLMKEEMRGQTLQIE
jgi:hypothetical protein